MGPRGRCRLSFLLILSAASPAAAAPPKAPKPTSTATAALKAATAEPPDDGAPEDDPEDAVDARCCARLAGEFAKIVKPEAREQAERERRCCALKDEILTTTYSTMTQDDGPGKLGSGVVHAEPETSYVGLFVKMVGLLGSICLLAYVVLGKMLPRLLRIETPVAQRRLLQVVDRLPIDQRRSIVVLRIGDQYCLVGISDQNVSLISRLDSGDIDQALASMPPPEPKMSSLASALFGRRPKES